MNLDELSAGVPKTELLYLREMQLSRAEAATLKVVPEKRTHVYLMLDRTIFHPKGGGQPSDRGAIRASQFQVQVKKAIFHKGVVTHWCKITSGTPMEGPVTCELDWTYRYLMMRRHTAAHLLDHCLAQTTARRVETTDSWLEDPCYVGYNGTPPDRETVQRLQGLADDMIRAGAEVRIGFLSPDEGRSLLEKAPNFERLPELKEIRTVTIEGCAPIPCGGTHVSNIKEIKQLKVDRCEVLPQGGFRIHFSVPSA